MKTNFKRKLIFHQTKHFTSDVRPFYGTPTKVLPMTLKVWQNKCSMYAKLYSGEECISASHFYEKDGDMTLHRVKEYYSF